MYKEVYTEVFTMKNDAQINCRLPNQIKLQVEELALESETSVSQWLLDLILEKLNVSSSVDKSVDKIYTDDSTPKLTNDVEKLKHSNTELLEQISALTQAISELNTKIDAVESKIPVKPKRGRPRNVRPEEVLDSTEVKTEGMNFSRNDSLAI